MSSIDTCDICGYQTPIRKYHIDEKEKVYSSHLSFPLDAESILLSKISSGSFDFCYACSHKFLKAFENFFFHEKNVGKVHV